MSVDGEVAPGSDLAHMLAKSFQLCDGDIIVIAQKAVSKAEGRMMRLDSIKPSLLAQGIADQYGKDSRVVELVLQEASEIVRMGNGIIITRTPQGHVCANSGVDQSNVPLGYALLLPVNSDASALGIRRSLQRITGVSVGVIISDTAGRPFRNGQTDICLGCSGVPALRDYVGTTDMFGRTLRVSVAATADQLAGAAELVMQKSTGCPAAVIRGLDVEGDGLGQDMIRRQGDLFS